MQWVKYLKDVAEPARLAGAVGDVRELADHYVGHLLQDQSVEVTEPPEKHGKKHKAEAAAGAAAEQEPVVTGTGRTREQLEAMRVDDLRELAAAEKVDLAGVTLKADIVNAILKHKPA
jgi:hypothetical protein